MIPALVLTAGLATRLRPLSLVRAKAALPVGGIPLAGRILQQLARAGVTDAVLNLHHLPASLTSRIGDGSEFGIRTRYSWESPIVLGSAGGPRKALSLMGATRFLVLNGDTLTDLDIPSLIDAHVASGALVTMAVIRNVQPHRYGGVLADQSGSFTGVVARDSSVPSYHFIGVQVVEAQALARLDEGAQAESVRTLYPALAAERQGSVRVHECSSSFLDIGTPRDYVDTCRAFAVSDTPFIERGVHVSVHPTARLQDVIAWDDVSIEAGTRLDNVVLTDGVRVPVGSEWKNAILRVADGASDLNERVIGDLAVTSLARA